MNRSASRLALVCSLSFAALALSPLHGQESPEQGTTTQPATQPSTQPASQPAVPARIRSSPVPRFIKEAKPSGKKVLIHYKTAFSHDDTPGCVAFNIALAALAEGHQVEMFYDAGGVFDIKLWQGGPASYHYEVPQKLKNVLATLYPIRAEEMPATYQEFLYWLHDMGVTITYNGAMAALVDLQEQPTQRSEQIEPIAQPLTLEQVIEHRAAADFYFEY